MITDVVILAGGFGERLWPASCPANPKQFLALQNGLSFIQMSIKRALALRISGKIIIVTRRDIVKPCIEQSLKLAEQDDSVAEKIKNDLIVLAEPCPKHTSAAIMSAVCLSKKFDNRNHTLLVLTSDHVIEPMELFVADCNTAASAAEKGYFVCYAIPPSEPSVGYGYIKTGKDITDEGKIFAIDNFKEKPDQETAKKYLAEGSYWWNSGMFAFDADMFENEMKSCTPEVYNAFVPMMGCPLPEIQKREGIFILDTWEEMEETYRIVPSIAVDKSIAEKSKHACAVKAAFNWTDVGSWDVFSGLCTTQNKKQVVEVESNGNFVYSDIPVALCGVKDLVVVVKNGALLVMKKGGSALVRNAVNAMKQ